MHVPLYAGVVYIVRTIEVGVAEMYSVSLQELSCTVTRHFCFMVSPLKVNKLWTVRSVKSSINMYALACMYTVMEAG